MKLNIPKDIFNNSTPPRTFLCTPSKKIMGEIPAYDRNLNAKWNSYSDFSFSVDRQYTDVIDGTVKVNTLFDKIEGLRLVLVENIGYFIIQDPDTTYSDKDSKTLSCFSLEYGAGSKYLENFYINTGTEDSKEVIYEQSKYGYNATKDQMYKPAKPNGYDAEEDYYHRVYTDERNYTYERIPITNEATYKSYFGDDIPAEDVLYVHGYANVRFYDPYTPELSLLHLVFEAIPEWTIGHVDYSLYHKERKFEEERIAVYDFLTNEVPDTFKCVVEWDTLTGEVNFYEEADDGITEDNTVQTRFDTDVYISRENLASEIQIRYSTDNIKTKLKVSGADVLDIREVNLGKNYLINLDYYHNEDWMDQELIEAYDDYLDAVKENTPKYTEATQKWVAAQKEYNHLMHNIAVETSIVLVDDVFKKLYCLYEPYDTAYIDKTIDSTYQDGVTMVDELYSDEKCTEKIDITKLTDGQTFVVQGYRFDYDSASGKFKFLSSMLPYNRTALLDKLALYHVDDDIEGKTNDNILLTLKNVNSDTATIRIYDPKSSINTYIPDLHYYVKNDDDTFNEVTIENADTFAEYKELYTNDYKIKCTLVSATTGTPKEPDIYDLSEWINGTLTADKLGLKDYTVTSIGTMGVYLVLAKNEADKSVLEDYGINQLQEKYDSYVKVFLAQTEDMLNKEGKNCIVSNKEPGTDYKIGDRWLDTDSRPAVLYELQTETVDTTEVRKWVKINATDDEKKDAENYGRYIDNYEKMVATQEMLVQKKQEAEYWRDGYVVPNRSITYKTGDSDVLFYSAADAFFRELDDKDESIITNGTLYNDYGIPIFTFTHHTEEQSYVISNDEYNKDTQYYQMVTTVYDLDTYKPATENTAEDKKVNIYTYKPVSVNEVDYEAGTLYVLQKDNLFAVYLNGTTPYIAYADSQGVHQAIRNALTEATNFERFFTSEQWVALSPLIREDEYSDSNFLLTGYESEEERLRICNELNEAASKELKTLSQPSLEFSMTMGNILALPEFEPIKSQFALGNFIRIELRPGIVKRSRLLEVSFSPDDLSNFNTTFGNLVTTKSEIDIHADLLKQAVQAGKQVAAAAGDWQSAVDKSNKLEEAIASGLQGASLQVGRASGQAISWDDKGLFCRKFVDGSTDTYVDEQIAIINNKIVFTNDGWKTSKAALGEFELDINGDGVNEKMYGLLADAVVSGYVKGSVIEGGSLRIGGDKAGDGVFIVNEDGSVEIKVLTESDGKLIGIDKYASQSAVEIIDNAYRFRLALSYDGSTIFSDTNQTCTITCDIYDYDTLITDKVIAANGTFSWRRSSSESDEAWNASHIKQGTNANKITLTTTDVVKNSNFTCSVDFDETKITT